MPSMKEEIFASCAHTFGKIMYILKHSERPLIV
jgi:hypothetical protein